MIALNLEYIVVPIIIGAVLIGYFVLGWLYLHRENRRKSRPKFIDTSSVPSLERKLERDDDVTLPAGYVEKHLDQIKKEDLK